MSLKPRQQKYVDALAGAGMTSPVTRQELVAVCESTGIYACPPSWITQDSDRLVERGLYNIPELSSATPATTPAPVQGAAPVAVVSAPAMVQTATAAMTLGMTGGERTSLIPLAFDGYVKWGHFSDVEKIVRSKQFYPIFITGLSGNGKTLMVEQVCAKLKRECFRVNITRQTDEDDLLGGFRLINGNTVWQDGPVVSAMKQGGVLLLDEVDLASHNIMCLQPVLEGKGVFLKKIGQWVTPAPGFTVFATANTKGKGSDDGRFIGTSVLNEAFLDRFPITLEQPYATPATERKILAKQGCDNTFADHLTRWADMIRKAFSEGAVDEIISTRRLVNITKAYAIFGSKEKSINFCLSRFDDDTREAFSNLYSKVDADMLAGIDESTSADNSDATESADASNNKCPF